MSIKKKLHFLRKLAFKTVNFF